MGTTQSEVTAEKIPWVPLLVLTVVISFFGPFYTCIQPNGAWYALGSIGCKLILIVKIV